MLVWPDPRCTTTRTGPRFRRARPRQASSASSTSCHPSRSGDACDALIFPPEPRSEGVDDATARRALVRFRYETLQALHGRRRSGSKWPSHLSRTRHSSPQTPRRHSSALRWSCRKKTCVAMPSELLDGEDEVWERRSQQPLYDLWRVVACFQAFLACLVMFFPCPSIARRRR